jgi:TctA family transporter
MNTIMKKAVDILSVVSVLAVLLMLLLLFMQNLHGRYFKFVSEWVIIVLVFLAIPLIGKGASLAVKKDEMKPKKWLVIYGVALAAFVTLFVLTWDFQVQQIKDLPYAFRQEHLVAIGEAKDARIGGRKLSYQFCTIDNISFSITRSDFLGVKEGETYVIAYLPNTKYIIDIYGKNGESLLKK